MARPMISIGKTTALAGLFVFILVVPAVAQITITGDTTAFFAYGIAETENILPDTFGVGVYDEIRNGYYINNEIRLSGGFEQRYDYYAQITTTSRTGSPYLPLQLEDQGEGDFSVRLDNLWMRIHLSRLLFPHLSIGGGEVTFQTRMGKYRISAPDTTVSDFGLESVQGMIKTANASALSLEASYRFSDPGQSYFGTRSTIDLELGTAGVFDDAIQRLYDEDGGMGNHGQPVVGEYAPQLIARLGLNNYVLPFGRTSIGLAYAVNGAGIYSGHSFGGSAVLDIDVMPNTITVPISAGAAYYEKNIDALAGFAGLDTGANTTGIRDTLRVGSAIGIRHIRSGGAFLRGPMVLAEATVSGSYSRVSHIYRDPVEVMNLGIDGRYNLPSNLFVGGGLMVGTLTDAVWRTSEGVVEESFYREYSPADHLGYELYGGVDIVGSARFIVGYAHMKGLSMNYGLESIPGGMVKYRQSGTAVADMLWETRSIYVLTTITL